MALRVFISYSHRNPEWLKAVLDSLATLVDDGTIAAWYDGDIRAGEDWAQELRDQLDSADVIVFLVTQQFLAAKGCKLEVDRALERKELDDPPLLFPILLTASDYQYSKLAKLNQAGPWMKPIGSVDNAEGLLAVAQRFRKALADLLADRTTAATVEPPLSGRRSLAEITGLLPYLCNRNREANRIKLQIEQNWNADPRRPLLMVASGDDSSLQDGFRFRLKRDILPELAKQVTGAPRPVQEHELQWTDFAETRDDLHSFLHSEVSRQDISGVWNTHISVIDYTRWPGTDGVNRFLDFWLQWPGPQRSELCLICLYLKFRRRPGELCETREREMRQYLEYLKSPGFQPKPGLPSVVLPEFGAVPLADAESWTDRLVKAGLCSEAKRVSIVSDEIKKLYPDDVEGIAMNELAPKLERIVAKLQRTQKAG